MGMPSQRVSFENDRGQKLVGILDLPEGIEKPPVVLILHSFTGYKELKPLHAIAEKCNGKGIAAFRFDFADCIGESEGKCEHMRLSHQVRDVVSAVAFLKGLGPVDGNRMGIAGHSLGGTTAINAAAQIKSFRALVTVAALADPKWESIFNDEKVNEWRQKGVIEVNSHKRGPVSIEFGFYEDLLLQKCDQVIQFINCPVRVIHGNRDELLGLMNAACFFDHALEPKDLKVIDGADHLYLNDPYRSEMAGLVAEWMEKHL